MRADRFLDREVQVGIRAEGKFHGPRIQESAFRRQGAELGAQWNSVGQDGDVLATELREQQCCRFVALQLKLFSQQLRIVVDATLFDFQLPDVAGGAGVLPIVSPAAAGLRRLRSKRCGVGDGGIGG